jgi:NAD(P)-dependent dehydrogenase (short-subunit alcohol dehydrogenase family)
MAHGLAELGAELVLVDRPGQDLSGLEKALGDRWGARVQSRYVDLEEQARREELIQALASESGELNILVNNAAFVGTSDLAGWAVKFPEQSVETWRRAIEVNLTAVFELCQGLAPMMSRSNGASVINIASIYGALGPDWRLYENTGMANPAAYSASKGGLIQLTRWLATTLAPDVRVNAISPGGIYRDQPRSFVEKYSQRTPLGRMGAETDIVGAVVYLASDLSSYVTGQNLYVDGGWGTW